MNPEYRKTILSVNDFSFSYESLNESIIRNVSFSVFENETILIIGPSGSGKSSLALCMNGLYPDAVEGSHTGNIFFKSENIAHLQNGELNQKIGIVFQDPDSQFCMITVEDELAFTLENRKIPASEMPARISEILQTVGMQGFQKRKIQHLSGGQKQKIALAAVLLLEPELLILDEPTSNLDPVSRLEFIQLIRRIQTEHGLTVIIIEHQTEDWLDFTDRVIVIGKFGNVIANGDVETIFTDNKDLLIKEGILIKEPFTNSFVTNHVTPTNEEIIINVQNLMFQRKNEVIFRSIDLNIKRGEFIAIIGENGAGKSTLLQLMAGLLTPDKGEITFHGKSLKKWHEKELRERMGFVFQNPEHQFITDTVYDEITFGMKLSEYPEEIIQSTAQMLMEKFHLDSHPFHNPFSLSGGQKRRLSVATMLDETPDILFFDEPTFGQDAKTTKELMDTIRQLRDSGTAIVFVTHDMDIVDIVDRAVVIYEQSIQFNGVPIQLWEQEYLLKKARLRLPYRMRKHKALGTGQKKSEKE